MRFRPRTQEESRLLTLSAGAALWCGAILFQLFQLEVVRHDELRRQAENQQLQSVEVQAPRGTIFDRNREPLALSVKVESVFVNPRQVPDLDVAADLLSQILGLDRKTLHDRLSLKVEVGKPPAKEKVLRGFVWVKRKVSLEEASQLRSLRLDWIGFQSESQRLYPKGELGATVVGGVDFAEEGNAGVELKLNSMLKGRNGTARVLTDVRGASIESVVTETPKPGANLVLSIDERLQFLAEKELRVACDASAAKSGTLVILRPDDGEVLAIASYNRADPQSRQNLAVIAPFEPGSVFKVFTIAGALEAGVARPETVFPCGVLAMFGRVLHEAKHAYGPMAVMDILAKSSNVGAAQIGLRLREERLSEFVRKFGFGARTGILLPAEEGGWLRPVNKWNRDTILSIPMGHEISTTAIQLAQACAVIANGGFLVRPRLVLAKQAADGPEETIPLGRRETVLSPDRAHQMRQMMEGVVLNGTGKAARLNGYTAAGKTGSAQIYDDKVGHYTHSYNASFMGFAPVTKPAIVVVVTLNGTSGGSAGYGGVVAAPLFRKVTQEALRVLEVPKDLPETLAPPEALPPDTNIEDVTSGPEPAPDHQVQTVMMAEAARPALPIDPPGVVGPRVPDFTGKSVRAVMEHASAIGIPVVLNGKGRATMQMPPAGAVLPPGHSVKVQFSR